LWRIDHRPEALDLLGDLVRDVDEEAAVRAAEALANVGPEARGAVPSLEEALEDWRAGLRVKAAWALWEVSGQAETVLPVLLAALEHPDEEVGEDAAWTLGKMGPAAREAVPLLLDLLHDEESFSWAGDALKKIDPEAAARAGVE
jgi:HEAT repeat protein